MTDENNITPPSPVSSGAGSPIPDPSKNEPILDSPPTEPEVPAEKSIESETVHIKVEPVASAGAVSSIPDPSAPPPAAPVEPEIAPVESTPAEPEIEKSEPEVEPTPAPAEPEVEKIEPTPDPIGSKNEPTEPTPAPVESEIAPEISAEPEVPAEKPAEPELVQSEIIAGAPSRPGDKIEKDAPATSAPAVDSNSKKPADEKKFKTGFKPDGTTPLDGEEKMFSAIGYIAFLALLPLIARRDSEFAQHHGRQGLVITILFIVLWMIATLSGTLRILVLLLNVIAIIGGFALAYKGDWFKIPGIYELSLKLKSAPPPPPPANPNSQTPPEQNSAPANLSLNKNEVGEGGEG